MPQRTLRRLSCCFVIFLFISCSKEENFNCRINFFNGVIGGSPFTFKADNISIADTVRYESLKANAIFPSGTYTISLTSSGVSQNLLLTNLGANETYTALVYDSSKQATFFMRKDILPATPGFGRCAVRIYTLIPGAANLYLAKDTARSGFLITGKAFNDFATSTNGPAFQEIDTVASPTIFRGDSVRAVRINSPLRSGKMYTFFITGTIKDSLQAKCTVQLHN